jgi:hypothetical protein
MPDYQNGRIYKIINLETNECYIGSTTLALSQRLAQHVVSYKRWLKGKGNNITSFKIIANDDYDIVLIELFPCNSKEELHARESHYTHTIQCVNKIKNQGLIYALGGQTQYKKQYYIDNKKQIDDQKKQYYINNKEHIQEHKKQYREQNKEHIREQRKQYNLDHKDQQKQYNIDNKEHIREQKKQYREQTKEHIIERSKQYKLDHTEQIKQYNIDNKEHIREQKKQYREQTKEHIIEQSKQYREQNKDKLTEKHDCQCGGCYITNHKARHLKTSKHLQWVNDQ